MSRLRLLGAWALSLCSQLGQDRKKETGGLLESLGWQYWAVDFCMLESGRMMETKVFSGLLYQESPCTSNNVLKTEQDMWGRAEKSRSSCRYTAAEIMTTLMCFQTQTHALSHAFEREIKTIPYPKEFWLNILCSVNYVTSKFLLARMILEQLKKAVKCKITRREKSPWLASACLFPAGLWLRVWLVVFILVMSLHMSRALQPE